MIRNDIMDEIIAPEVTIEITQFCENDCPTCSSEGSPQGRHLPTEAIREFLDRIKFTDRINISGGEPLAHPDFYNIHKLCMEKTSNVWVYSNVIRNLIYNTHVIEEVRLEANVCVVPGREIYIPMNAHKVHLLKLVQQGRAKDYPEIDVSVSRNFWDPEYCEVCEHVVLQADGKIVQGPCRKKYEQCQTPNKEAKNNETN